MGGDHIRISKTRKDGEILAPEQPLTRLRLHSPWMQQTWIVALNAVYWGWRPYCFYSLLSSFKFSFAGADVQSTCRSSAVDYCEAAWIEP